MSAPRITARIRTEYDTEKTVSLRSDLDHLQKKLKQYFHATHYIIYKIGDVQFYHGAEWKEIERSEDGCR